jgi:hypothetical protein
VPKFSPAHEFSETWHRFINALTSLWTNKQELSTTYRLNHYAELSRNVLKAAVETTFVNTLRGAWLQRREKRNQRVVADLFLDEIKSFSAAVEAPASPNEADMPGRRQELLSDAGVVLGSAKDLFEDLPWWAKGTICLLREVAEFFKGK